MFDTNFLFSPGKMLITADMSAGSSGKGRLNAWICEHADNWQFACNAFMSNAAHWVELDDGTRIMYQALNSCAYQKEKFEKIYICGGAVTELEPLLQEIEQNGLNDKTLGIHPLVAIVQEIDRDYERGLCDFNGKYYDCFMSSENMRLGSTLHGVGAARARRILRKDSVLLAKDVKQLQPFICDTREEIISRLDRGQAGLLEIAQGFQLGYLEPLFYPKVTSRNCTIAAGLDDCGIPPYYAGNVVLNARTYPIRVNSDKFIHAKTDKVLTHDEISNLPERDVKIIKGNSGPGYPDQAEISWDYISQQANEDILEFSSLTKLPRRVFEFSNQNLREAIKYNRTTGSTYVSINFANYVDPHIKDLKHNLNGASITTVSKKLQEWCQRYKIDTTLDELGAKLLCWGTGPCGNSTIMN